MLSTWHLVGARVRKNNNNKGSQASLEEFNEEVEGWLPLLPDVSLRQLTGQMLADVVRRKGATACSLEGWGWRELKVLPVAWFDGLASVLSKVEEIGVWPDGLLDAYRVYRLSRTLSEV